MNYKFPEIDEHNMFNAEDVQEYAIEFFKLSAPEATKIVGEQAIEIERLKEVIRKMSSAASNATEAMDKVFTTLSEVRNTSYFRY